MKVAYVAGPYRAETEYELVSNIRVAEKAAVALWQMGYAVICPHMNSAHMGGVCQDKVFLRGDLEILRRCDLIVLVDGWESSAGARDEYIQADLISMPKFEYPRDAEKLTEFSRS